MIILGCHEDNSTYMYLKLAKRHYSVSMNVFSHFYIRMLIFYAELISKTGENGDVTDNAAYSNGRDVKKKSPDKAVKSYTVIDLVKSKRILISSLIMWFAW